MRDPRLTELADRLAGYSIDVRPGENVLIEVIGGDKELAKALVEAVAKRAGRPYVELADLSVRRTLLRHATREQIEEWAAFDLERMRRMHGYIGVRAGDNISELADVPEANMRLYEQLYVRPVHLERRVKATKWVVLRWPNASMAQLAGMSTEAFEDFYFRVCNLDYAMMDRAMEPLKALMERTDRVRITGPGTDLTFSIKGIGAKKCSGKRNIPDGEVFTAPVRDSVNGTITYNTPSNRGGFTFERIRFTFVNGRIVEADANDPERLNQILDTDEGARYIGEFSLGFNPHILHPMNDTLFDEKIAGSLHFTPGQAYEETDNGNRSSVHWDLVLIQRPEYGGGEVWFDGRLIRKDGRFVVPELEGLNPENLS